MQRKSIPEMHTEPRAPAIIAALELQTWSFFRRWNLFKVPYNKMIFTGIDTTT